MSVIKVSIVSSNEEIFREKPQWFCYWLTWRAWYCTRPHTSLTGLAPGPVRVQNNSDEETFFCSGGFIEVQPDIVTILQILQKEQIA